MALSFLNMAVVLLAIRARAQTTLPAISQIPDGQIQGPAVDSSTHGWPSPHDPYDPLSTSCTAVTDSRGVMTDTPSVETSPSELGKSPPVSPTPRSYSSYWYGNSSTAASTTLTVSLEDHSATLSTRTVGVSASRPTKGTSSASARPAQATGDASTNTIAGPVLALVILGLGVDLGLGLL